MSLDNEQSKVIQGRFHLTRKLGAGSFGEIFEAKDLKTGKLYACKAESLRTKHPQLRLEYQIYRALQNSKSFVRVWGYVTHYNHQIMIMDKLGESLEQLFTLCGRKFSIRCVCAIAIQILTRIEELHKHNYLHRDIKPDNFLIGHTPSGDPHFQNKEASKIYMIDLGLGKVWKEGGRHIPEKHGKRLIGTPRYASINTHFGHEQSRRDDLESLGYMLMYFAHGQLPWQGLRGQTKEEKYQKIGHKKRDTRLSELCAGYPEEFRQYLSATQKLSFQADPPYEQYRQWFRNVLERYRTMDTLYDFDWQNRNHAIKAPHKASSMSKRRSTRRATQPPNQAPQPQQTLRNKATNNNFYVNNPPPQQAQPPIAPQIPRMNTTNHARSNHQTYRHSSTRQRNTNPTQQMQQQHSTYNNNVPLALPNLGQQPPPHTQMVPQNQFSNYIDRYQRCRNMLSQQQQQNHTKPLQQQAQQQQRIVEIGSNSPPNHSNSPNHQSNPAQLAAAAHAAQINNMLFQQQNQSNTNNNPRRYGITPKNKTFMNDYQELVANYKKLEAQNQEYKRQNMEYKRKQIEYQRIVQTSESNYKKLKQKCNNYVYQINDLQKTNHELTKTIQSLNAAYQPSQKRRKLNNGMQRRGAQRL
eukprot:82291_1